MSLFLNGLDILPRKNEIDIIMKSGEKIEEVFDTNQIIKTTDLTNSPFDEDVRYMIRLDNDCFIEIFIDDLPEYNEVIFNERRVRVKTICEQKRFYSNLFHDYSKDERAGMSILITKIQKYIDLLNEYECD